MKSLKAILGIALSIGGLGTTAAVAGVSMAAENNIQAAEADISSTTVFYLEGTLNNVNCWNTDDSARKFNASNDKKASLVWTFKAGDIFKVYNQTSNKWAGYNSALSANFKQAATDNNIEVVTSGTYEIILNNNHDTYGDISYAWTSQSINKISLMHIWATSDNANWISANSTTKIGFWSNNLLYTVYAADYTFTGVDSTGLIYYRFTVPSNITGMKFLRYSSDGSSPWDTNMGDITTILANQLYYVWYENNWNNPKASTGSAKSGSFTAAAFAKAIEDIETCNSDSKIGYEAYPTLKSCFYDQLKSGENLAGVNITDYSKADYDNNSKSYDGLSKNATFTALEKWNAISSKYSAAHASNQMSPLSNQTNSTIIIIAAISVVSLTALGAFFILRKKKFER